MSVTGTSVVPESLFPRHNPRELSVMSFAPDQLILLVTSALGSTVNDFLSLVAPALALGSSL